LKNFNYLASHKPATEQETHKGVVLQMWEMKIQWQ